MAIRSLCPVGLKAVDRPTVTSFENAFSQLLRIEGGFNHITEDHGGPTNHGISLRFLRLLPKSEADINGDGHVDIEDIRQLGNDDAEHFYRKYFWDHYGLARVRSHGVAAKLFGLHVNMRGRVAGRVAQRACAACGSRLSEDGIIGAKTVRAINSYGAQILVPALRAVQEGVYRVVVAEDASQRKFLHGWVKRARGPV